MSFDANICLTCDISIEMKGNIPYNVLLMSAKRRPERPESI